MKISTKGLYAVRFMLNLAAAGGYRLARPASDITVLDVLAVTEGTLAPVSCLACEDDFDCSQPHICIEIGVWKGLDKLIKDYLSGITLQDILNQASSVAADSYSI